MYGLIFSYKRLAKARRTCSFGLKVFVIMIVVMIVITVVIVVMIVEFFYEHCDDLLSSRDVLGSV